MSRVEGKGEQGHGRWKKSLKKFADIAKRTGTTEDEARLLYCLEHTGEAFDALPNVTAGERIQFAVHHQALVNMMAARVVGRDHPEARGRGEPPEGTGFDPLEPVT